MKAFTFIEFLLVIAIISLIGATTTPILARFFVQNEVENTAVRITESLRTAQFNSMTKKQGSIWGVNVNSGILYIFAGASFAGRNSAFDEIYPLPSGVSVTNLTDRTFTSLTGVPSSTTSIVVTGISGTQTITINSLGVVSR